MKLKNKIKRWYYIFLLKTIGGIVHERRNKLCQWISQKIVNMFAKKVMQLPGWGRNND